MKKTKPCQRYITKTALNQIFQKLVEMVN